MYTNFINDCLRGTATLSDLDDYVDKWHDSTEITQTLEEFLGVTAYEYNLWLLKGDNQIFQNILFCREQGVDLENYLQSSVRVN